MELLLTLLGFLSAVVATAYYLFRKYKVEEGVRLGDEATSQFMSDISKAKKKILLVCQTFSCSIHPDINIVWFSTIVSKLKMNGVDIVMVSKEDPPEFIQKLIDSDKIYFEKCRGDLPFVGRLVDRKIADISYNKEGLVACGSYLRAKHLLPGIGELLEDRILSRHNHAYFKQL